MAKFFIKRPIVAMVISIIMTILGLVAMVQLPVAQFPNIAPPEIMMQATYVGADAVTLEQSVATPIEQQVSGVDNMLYMYSVNANNGQMTLRVNFDITTKPNDDQILTQMRYLQAESQLPQEVRNYGVTIKKSTASPLALFSLYSPNGTYDDLWLNNYAYINLNDPMSRVPGIGQVQIFGAGQYAMRFWVRPDRLAKLGLTIPEILDAIKKQNTVNPAGQIGAEPVPPGQEFTYTVRAQGRLVSKEEFEEIVVRATTDGSIVRLKDVARIELGAQSYGMKSRLNGKPAAIVAIYQLPGSNAIDTMDRATKLMEEMKERFPADLDYTTSLDTTLAVREGINEIVHTLGEAVVLVIIVVFIFLQGWRATLIPLLAVPVSLIGTFMLFPLLGFSINTLSLLGLVLAIGLVVDDAIVVVEAVEHHIEHGLSPRDATFKAMEEVSGPVVAIALILAAVFVPTAFIPGITGRLYQQFAVTIALSVVISAFNALTLSPALSGVLLRPKRPARGPLGIFFGWFNRWFDRATDGYVNTCRHLIRKAGRSMVLLALFAIAAGFFGVRLPTGFLPMEDQGYVFLNVQLPVASSLQRTDEVCKRIEEILSRTPGIQYASTVVGYSLLSSVSTTYSAFFFVTLAPWEERTKPEEKLLPIFKTVNRQLAQLPEAQAFLFPPPAIPGVGTSGGVSFVLEDRSGKDIAFLAENTQKFIEAARRRPEIASVNTTFIPSVPQVQAKVDRDKVLKQGVNLGDVYQTLQTFMGGAMVNYFNRFGRVWQVYVQADGEFRTRAENVGQFYVRNASNDMVPLSTLVSMDTMSGPEFTMRFNAYRSAQLFVSAKPGYSSGQAMKALEEVFTETMPREMGYDYIGMSFQEKLAAEGVPASVIFGFSLLFVFLILAAQYESWALPFSVLLCTPIAVFGAFGALWALGMENDVFTQIGLVMLIGLSAKNAILIVEFAKLEYEGGKSIVDSALAAARLRLRPILMTSFAFILGVVPLVLASGAGAHGRILLGIAVLGGMLAASFIAIFLIPVAYAVVENLVHRHDVPTPEGPRPDRPTTAGDGEAQVPAAQPKAFPTHARTHGAIEMRHWILTAIPILLIGACKMGPDYTRPETPAEEAWRMAPATAESLANLPWWELLKDQELQKLIRISLEENQDLRVAVASVEQFRAQLIMAKWDLAPSLEYQGNALTFHNTNTKALTFGPGVSIPDPTGDSSDGTDFSQLSAGAGLKWEIDLWGRIRRSIEAAHAQLLSQEENRRAVVLGLVGNVAEAYFDLRALDLQIEITKRTLKAWDDSVRISRLRFQHGDIPKLDLDRFEAERASTAAQLADLEQQMVQQENQLSLLLGRRPMAIPRGLALTAQSVPPIVPPGLPSALLQRRPDIVQAEQQLAAATAGIGVAQAQRFPQLALTGNAGVAGFQFNSLSAGPFATFGASANLAGPLLNATALGYQVHSAEAQTKQAMARYQKAILTAFKEVEDALIAVQKTREKADAQQQQVASLQSALGFATQRYQGGRASYLDVLTAQRNLFDAELALVKTRRTQLVSVIQLYKALGGGWSPAAPPEAGTRAVSSSAQGG